MAPDLNRILQYQNNEVLLRYQTDHPEETGSPSEIFSELLKFIWLSLKHTEEKSIFQHDESLRFECVMHHEMGHIDKMWHTFLLFTRDYQDFCQRYLNGIFFHHEPVLESGKNQENENYEQELALYLSYIYDNLGEESLRKWFKE